MNILLAIAIPIFAALLLVATEKKTRLSGIISLSAAVMSAACAIYASMNETYVIFPWLGGVFDFSLKTDGIAALMLFVSSFIAVVSSAYAMLSGVPARDLISLLLLQGCAAGAFASDSIAALVFFAGAVPFIMRIAPAAKENNPAKGKGPALKNDGLLLANMTARDIFFIAGMFLFLCLMSGAAITGYISGTMTISEIASARLTLEYGWSAAAFLLVLLPAFYLMGVYPFLLCKEEVSASSPAWFRAYSRPMGVLLGALMLIRAENMLFNPGNTVRLALFLLGILTVAAAAVKAFEENSRRLPENLLIANAGLIAAAVPYPEAIPGGLFMLLSLPGICGFMLSADIRTPDSQQYTAEGMARAAGAVPVYSKNAAAQSAAYPFICLALAYSWAYAGLPPFGDAIRQTMAGMAKGHKALFLVVCAVQALICSGLIKNFFSAADELSSMKKNCVEGNPAGSDADYAHSAETGSFHSLLAGLPLLLLLCCGFGGTMAENMAILPAMESLGFSFALPLRGSGIVYITFIISFLSAFILFQSAEAVSGTGPSEAGIFIKDTLEKVKLSKPAFYRFLSFIINPVSFLGVILKMIFSRAGAAGKTAKSKSVLKTAVWKWPSDIISEIADCCTPLTESSINLSLAAAIALAAAFIIIAAAGGFN